MPGEFEEMGEVDLDDDWEEGGELEALERQGRSEVKESVEPFLSCLLCGGTYLPRGDDIVGV